MKKSRKNALVAAAELALGMAADALPLYSHPKSPKKFTQPQLLACLVLKAYLKRDYRGTEDLLGASAELRAALGLSEVPDHSTLQKFAERAVSPAAVDQLLAALLARVGPEVTDAAMDSTGLEPTAASAHYRARSGKARRGYVKVSVVVLCGSLLPAAVVVSRGPGNDKAEAPDLLLNAADKVQPGRLLADAGYDAEWVHAFCREGWGVESLIPAVVHRSDGTAGGKYRSRMTELPGAYGKRWHAESFMSGLKRTTGAQLAARKDATLDAEAALRVLAYAVRR